jgi:hypothetical protein
MALCRDAATIVQVAQNLNSVPLQRTQRPSHAAKSLGQQLRRQTHPLRNEFRSPARVPSGRNQSWIFSADWYYWHKPAAPRR